MAYQAHLQSPQFKKYKAATQHMVRSLKLIEVDSDLGGDGDIRLPLLIGIPWIGSHVALELGPETVSRMRTATLAATLGDTLVLSYDCFPVRNLQ